MVIKMLSHSNCAGRLFDLVTSWIPLISKEVKNKEENENQCFNLKNFKKKMGNADGIKKHVVKKLKENEGIDFEPVNF